MTGDLDPPKLLPYQGDLLKAMEGFDKKRLTIDFALPSRGMSKSIFRDLAICSSARSPREGLRGVTTNTIVVDEIGSGELTLDILREVKQRMTSANAWIDDSLCFDSIVPIIASDFSRQIPKEPVGISVGGEWIAFPDIKAQYRNPEFPEADTYVVLEKLDAKDPRNPNPAAGVQKKWFVLQGTKRQQVKNRTSGEARAWSLHTKTIDAIKKRRRDAIAEAERIIADNRAQLLAAPGFGGF